ncbi:hypothetical protein YPPY56_4680, partial [Yersinia pestis PY-56]
MASKAASVILSARNARFSGCCCNRSIH